MTLGGTMKTALQNFKQFMKQREKASLAFVNGDAGPLDRIATHVSPATIFGPMGGYVEGAKKVNATNEHGARMFEPGSKNSFKVLHMVAGDGVAFWAGIQRSTVRMGGKRAAISMGLRVTEVFQHQNGEWKLVHRHADPMVEESKKPKK
jgi:ketosteroid isomerase-like protein